LIHVSYLSGRLPHDAVKGLCGDARASAHVEIRIGDSRPALTPAVNARRLAEEMRRGRTWKIARLRIPWAQSGKSCLASRWVEIEHENGGWRLIRVVDSKAVCSRSIDARTSEIGRIKGSDAPLVEMTDDCRTDKRSRPQDTWSRP
jgi:hypothetical protein